MDLNLQLRFEETLRAWGGSVADTPYVVLSKYLVACLDAYGVAAPTAQSAARYEEEGRRAIQEIAAADKSVEKAAEKPAKRGRPPKFVPKEIDYDRLITELGMNPSAVPLDKQDVFIARATLEGVLPKAQGSRNDSWTLLLQQAPPGFFKTAAIPVAPHEPPEQSIGELAQALAAANHPCDLVTLAGWTPVRRGVLRAFATQGGFVPEFLQAYESEQRSKALAAGTSLAETVATCIVEANGNLDELFKLEVALKETIAAEGAA